MKVDLRITGGILIDPHRGIHGPGEVLIKGGLDCESRPGRNG